MTPRDFPRAAVLRALPLLAAVLLPRAVAADEPDRAGVTVAIAPGGAGYIADQEPVTGAWRGALGQVGVRVGLGWYTTPELALLVRVGAVSYERTGDSPARYTHHTFGVAAQYWVLPRVYAGAGVALAQSGWAHRVGRIDNGLALPLYGGVSVLQTVHHSLQLGLELMPALYGSDNALSAMLLGEYQYW